MKIILHGKFAADYGPGMEIQAASAFEALEAFSRQVGFYADRLAVDRPRARVIGLDSEDALRAATDPDQEIHVVPAMFGGGGKFGQIIVGALIIAIAFIPGIGPALSTALIVSGATTMLMGVMALFIKAPSINKATDPDASLYLGAAGMTTTIGTPIGLCVGRVKRAGHALSLDVTANTLSYGKFPVSPT